MSAKRKISDNTEDSGTAKTGKICTDEDAGYISRTGRVRKKSSKLLEMEESKEDIQHAILGKAAAKKKKMEESAALELPPPSPTPKKPKASVKPVPEATPPKGNKGASKITAKTPPPVVQEVEEKEIKPEPVVNKRSSRGSRASKKKSQKPDGKDKVERESLKLKVHLGSTPCVEKVSAKEATVHQPGKNNKNENKSVESAVIAKKDDAGESDAKPSSTKAKEKVKISFEDALASAPLVVALPKPIKKKKKEKDVEQAKKPKDVQASKDSNKEVADDAVNFPEIEPGEILKPTLNIEASAAEPFTVVKPESPDFAKKSTTDGNGDTTKPTKKKKKKIKGEPAQLAPGDVVNTGVDAKEDNDSNSDDILQIVVPSTKSTSFHKIKKLKKDAKLNDGNSPGSAYFDTNGKRKKPGKNAQSKKQKELRRKRRRRPGPTAYMLFCNLYRPKVLAENPDRDFSAISKRLGEIWQGLPEKEKLVYKRKAKRAAAKAAKALSIVVAGGSGGGGGGSGGSTGNGAATNPSARRVIIHPYPTVYRKTASLIKAARSAEVAQFKPPDTEPIDVAAHLKLLGESLSIIGTRLTEHKGQIAVQGSISVLLDSLLGALGPLTALTTQVPQMNAITDFTLASTLDNIAYFMPGL